MDFEERIPTAEDKPVNYPIRPGQFNKILPTRHIFSNCVYPSHPERQQCQQFYNTQRNAKSEFLCLNASGDVNGELIQKHVDIPKLKLFNDFKDSGTQTSKTILQLVHENRDLSPDSLMQSPRDKEDFKKIITSQMDNICYSLEGSVVEYKEQVPRTEKKSFRPPSEDYSSPHHDDSEYSEDNFPKMSLTEKFLSKTKYKEVSSISSSDCDERRNQYIQRAPPLKRLTKDHVNNFKSKSFVESCHHHYIIKESQKNRFRVKKIRDKVIDDESRSFYNCRTSITLTTEGTEKLEDSARKEEVFRLKPGIKRRHRNNSNSFMSPTIASEQKNQLPDIQQLHTLISPLRRGRSTSPKINCKKSVYYKEIKVPYIDQSDYNVPESGKSQQSSNRHIHRISVSNAKISPPHHNRPIFEEDLLKIDDLSLDLASSEGNLTGSVRVSQTNSTSSLDNTIANALSKLRDRDWNIALKGLAEVTELCRILDTDILFPHMTTVNQRLIELLRSPRSHVCRTACQAAGHLFEYMKDTRRPEFDDIVNLLLFKTADANKFIRQDANLSLDCMVTHINTFHAVRTLCAKGPSHKNNLVRTATARLLVCAVVIAGADNILNPHNNEHTRKRVILHMAKFIEDKHLETRKYGERLYKVLSKEPNFEMYLRKYLEKDEIGQIKKSLKVCERKK